MVILKDNEAINIVGGASIITAALITAVSKAISTIYGFGQNLGSAINRLITKKYC